MSERRFYVSAEEFGEKILLGPDQSRHLSQVLRLTNGDEVRIFDGLGRECVFVVEEAKRNGAVVRFAREAVPPAQESKLDFTLAVPLLKKSNTELVLQKAVELGVTRFVPLITARSEMSAERWKRDRAEKIAVEAAKQCGRATLPKIAEPIEFAGFIAELEIPGFIFYEVGGESLPDTVESGPLVAVTGPEGGWESSEVELAKAHGLRVVHLGGRILKAETAAIAAAVMIQNKYGDLN